MFDVEQFVHDCVAARREAQPRRAVCDLVRRAMSTPREVFAALRPQGPGMSMLHRDDELTVLHVVWGPHMTTFPHDHGMWAVIGIYAGQEDNVFYRRPAPAARTLLGSGGKVLVEGDVAVLGDNTIHEVTNPRDTLTGAIHVYGGDFVDQPRSQWGPGPQEERPYDVDQALQQFAAASAAWAAAPHAEP